jgi:uncharacterized membrane protein
METLPIEPIAGFPAVLLDSAGWIGLSLSVSTFVTALLWSGYRRWIPETTGAAGLPGVFLLFGQTLDGVTTIIGIDMLGFSEQVPLSRLVLELTAQLPVASVIGVGWALFALKLALVTGLLRTVQPSPGKRDHFVTLALLTAGFAGLLPGLNNLLLQASI